MNKKSGRNILLRLLPAFFIFIVSCNSNAGMSGDSPDSVSAAGCRFGGNGHSTSWTSHHYYCKHLGDGIVLIDYMRRFYIYPDPAIVYPHSYPAGPITSENYFQFFGSTYYGFQMVFGGWYPYNSVVYVHLDDDSLDKTVWFHPLMPENTCVEQCKADLKAEKTTIETEGKTLLAKFQPGTGALPCDNSEYGICLAGKEAFFAPIANGVLLLGTMASGLIIFRKKKQKK